VSAVPDVTSFAIGAAQRFVLMGCDGVWKVHLLSTSTLSRYLSLSLAISRYLSLSLAISRYLSLPLAISHYLSTYTHCACAVHAHPHPHEHP